MTSPLSPEFVALQRAVAGRYSLDRELGRGGMGIVYLAREVALERPVAIKLLPPSLAAVSGFRERFIREARTAAALAHPHIVPIHAVEEKDGLVFFVMEYIAGETLGERVRRSGPLATDEGTRILREVAWAIGHAHGRGVIHRDIKPDNILLEAGTGRALVTDLGIAHAEGKEVSGTAGTPHYMAPELLEGGTPSVRSDLYALGVTAWVALTGKRPFEELEGAALLNAQVQAPTPSIGTRAPRLPPRLIAAIDKADARDAADRWADAEAFATELGATQALRSVLPPPLRRFVWESRSLSEQAAFGLVGALTAELALILLYGWYDIAGVIFHPLAILLGMLGVFRLLEIGTQARGLVAAGWGQAAAVAGDKAEVMEGDPMLGLGFGMPKSGWGIAAWGFVKTLAAAAVVKWYGDNVAVSVVAAAIMIITPALTAVRLWRVQADGRSAAWSKLLSGRFGKWLFAIAGIGVQKGRAQPVVGEPTALALGASIEALYAALPEAQQQRLLAVPDLAARLQARAFAPGPERTPAVAALETLRLDILRLQAGTIGEPELTADLEAVRKVGEEIDRVVAAQNEVAKIAR